MMSTTSPGPGNPSDFPQELIDEIISRNQDDIAFILAAWLVFKPWRDTVLRYLFSKASFLCKADFTRWSTICASLPHVASYGREVNFHLASFPELEDRAMFSPNGFTARSLKKLVTTRGPREYISSFRSALDCRFPADSDFEVILPTMCNVTRVYWAIPEAQDGFNPLAANATRFLQAFPNVSDLSIFAPISAYAPELVHIMGFFPVLARCEFLCGRVIDLEDASPTPALAGDLSKLEELWFRHCGWMDWLVDDVFSKSLPRIGWGFDYPAFTPAAFVRLLSMISGTLEEISIGIPSERTFVHPLMDWTSLLDDQYSSLKVVEFEMAMELDEVFDLEERARLEVVVRDNVNIDRLVVKWSDSPREGHPWT